MTTVIQFPVVPKRYPPHMSLVRRLDEFRKSQMKQPGSKARVQEMTDDFRITISRSEKLANAMVWCNSMIRHPDCGKEWVLRALDDLKKYVEEQE